MYLSIFFLTTRPPPRSTLFPYTTLFRSNTWKPDSGRYGVYTRHQKGANYLLGDGHAEWSSTWNLDRKSTRLNSSHRTISYAVFCLKKKKKNKKNITAMPTSRIMKSAD